MFSRIGNALLSVNTSLHVIGLMAFLPFIVMYHRLPIPSFYGEWLAAALGTIALLPLLKRESWQPLDIPHVALIFPGLIVLLFIQWQLGMLYSSQYALMAASYLVWAFLLAILGNHIRKTLGWERIAVTLAKAMLIGGVLNSLFVILQIASHNGLTIPYLPNLRGYGAVGQVNHFANYMALALASLVFLFAQRHVRVSQALPLGLLFLAMLAFSGSRSTWLYLAAFFVLALYFRVIVLKQLSSRSQLEADQSRTMIWLALLMLPAFALVQLAISYLPITLAGALPSERLMDEAVAISGLTIRLHLWQESWQIFLQSPWLGIGLGQMRWETFQYLNPAAAANMPQLFEHSHNLFIHLLAEMGVGAALLVAAGILTWLRFFQWRNISLSTWWLLALLAVIGIHSLLEYPLWYTYFLGIAAFLLGAGEEKCSQVRLAFSGRALVVTVLVLSVTNLGSTYIANQKMQSWIYKGMAQDLTNEDMEHLHRDMQWVDNKSLMSAYANLMYAILLTPDETYLDDKLAIAGSAMQYVPTRRVAYRYPLMLALKGEREAAIAQLQRALLAFPGKITPEVRGMPFQYWQFYIELINDARPDIGLLKPEAIKPTQTPEK